MSKADDMFKEIGYHLILESNNMVIYSNGFEEIGIHKIRKDFYKIRVNEDTWCYIRYEELQAINEKVKENGLYNRKQD